MSGTRPSQLDTAWFAMNLIVKGSGPHQHPYLRRLEPALIEGQAAFSSGKRAKGTGGVGARCCYHACGFW